MARRFGTFKVTGIPQLRRELDRLGKRATKGLASAFFQIGEEIIGESKEKFVPVDQGILRASGFVELPKISGASVTVELGFGGPAGKGNVGGNSNTEKVGYAIVVHENPRAGRTGGVSPRGAQYKTWSTVGGWKYLERPFKRAQPRMPRRIAELLRRFEPKFR